MKFIAFSLALAISAASTAMAADANTLLEASGRGDASAVEAALKSGAPIDARDAQGRTALLVATHAAQTQVARILIRAGADVNAKDNIQDSPFLYAGAEGRLEILKLTVAAGADLKSLNRFGGTALIPASHHGHVETVEFLLTTPIEIDHINKLGWTALLEAIILGDGGKRHARIVELLAKSGANVQLADRDGASPLSRAKRRGFDAMVRILENAGAR